MTTDKQNFDEDPKLTNATDDVTEELETESADEMAEELALQEAGSEAAVAEPQPVEPENPESFNDDIPFEGGPAERHDNLGDTSGGSIFGSFGAISTTFPSGRTQLRSGLEDADWFNRFRDRWTESYAQTDTGNVQTFGSTEAAEVPVHEMIIEEEATDDTEQTDDDIEQLE